MRIRKGFVSNSSSSSFVAIGFIFDQDKLGDAVSWEDYDSIYNKNLSVYNGSEGGLEDNEIAFGKEIFTSDDEGSSMNTARFSLEEINDISEEIKDALKEYNLDFPELKVFGGTRCS